MLLSCTSFLSRLPLSVLYWFADYLIYPVMYHLMRYRRKLVAKSLRNSFPDKSEAERKTIEKAFYHQFGSTIVETIFEWQGVGKMAGCPAFRRRPGSSGG